MAPPQSERLHNRIRIYPNRVVLELCAREDNHQLYTNPGVSTGPTGRRSHLESVQFLPLVTLDCRFPLTFLGRVHERDAVQSKCAAKQKRVAAKISRLRRTTDQSAERGSQRGSPLGQANPANHYRPLSIARMMIS